MVPKSFRAFLADDSLDPFQVVADSSVPARSAALATLTTKTSDSMHHPILLHAIRILVLVVVVAVGRAHQRTTTVTLANERPKLQKMVDF